jgi:hypothetical protein
MSEIELLGPLGPLVGTWEGAGGEDTAPSATRGQRVSQYRERIVFTPTGRVDNHEQILYGLRYSTTAWRVGEPSPYHEELGYWMWDAGNRQVLRSFVIPRGIALLAGGEAAPDAKTFSLAAELGSPTYGIVSNKFLDAEFRTVAYQLKVTVLGPDSFEYEEDTVLQIKGRAEPFHHIDRHRLQRVAG